MSNNNQREAAGKKPRAVDPEANPSMQQVEAVIVPVEIFDQIKLALRKLSIEDGEVIYQSCKALRPQMVTMHQMPPGG